MYKTLIEQNSKPGVCLQLRPARQIRPAKPSHPARGAVLSVMKQ